MTFQKRKEDFICEHCGREVSGDGYTNHCPTCLWSKHVDNYPGDRAAGCGALMEPEDIVLRGGEFRVRHRCIGCNVVRTVRAANDDAVGEFLEAKK